MAMGKARLSMPFCLLISLAFLPKAIFGTIAVPEFNVSYHSMPALFGGSFSMDTPVSAHLQLIEGMPLLCKEGMGNETAESIEIPPDGLSVALLAQRGKCTFYEKALVASSWAHVEYIVIYDDEVSTQLVPMSSEHPSNISLLFVSYQSGMELRNLILQQQSGDLDASKAKREIIVEMDGVAPPLPSPRPKLNATGYMFAALTGFLAFVVLFLCVLTCAQAGLITAYPDERGRIILFAGGNGVRNTAFRIMGNGLLTEEQVLGLNEEKFKKEEGEDEDEDEPTCCCAICLDEFENEELVRVLPCGHKFHGACVLPWLTERHSSCPLCKFDILEHIISESKGQDEVESDVADDSGSSPIWRKLTGLTGWSLISARGGSLTSEDDGEGGIPVPTSEIEMELTSASQNAPLGPQP